MKKYEFEYNYTRLNKEIYDYSPYPERNREVIGKFGYDIAKGIGTIRDAVDPGGFTTNCDPTKARRLDQ